MTNDIRAMFTVDNWDEDDLDAEGDVARLTEASVTKTYEGDIVGTSTTEWLMAYTATGSASFVGVERIRGTVAGREGTMVLLHVGAFLDGTARGELNVVAGSGTGALATAVGSGTFVADPQGIARARPQLRLNPIVSGGAPPSPGRSAPSAAGSPCGRWRGTSRSSPC